MDLSQITQDIKKSEQLAASIAAKQQQQLQLQQQQQLENRPI